jgi:predicted anti-sigma-YlaC factor YlaD
MHHPIREQLEEYLRNAERRLSPEFHAHLEGCEGCRIALEKMRGQARLLQALRQPEELEPGAGFYGRVMERIETRRPTSIWNAFLEPVFVRPVVFASVIMLVLLASYMISTEPRGALAASSPEVIMAVEPHPDELVGLNLERDRVTVLFTLASYGE